jgi:hypothetical protein
LGHHQRGLGPQGLGLGDGLEKFMKRSDKIDGKNGNEGELA